MSSLIKFFALPQRSSNFRFIVDTNFVNAGATDGSQLNNQFILPVTSGNFTLSVSDGRPSVVVNNSNLNTYKTISLSPGIHTITLTGSADIRFDLVSPDNLKITSTLEFGSGFTLAQYSFKNCSNMVWDVPFTNFNILSRIFNGIKGISDNIDLKNSLIDKVIDASYIMGGIIEPPKTVFSGFFSSLTTAGNMYRDSNLSRVDEVQIIAPNLVNISGGFYGTMFRGRIVIKSNSLTNINNLCYGYTNPPSLGEVDIRRVTNANTFITQPMSRINTDATLLGWVNNFDWSVIPTVTNKVKFHFRGSTYSNNSTIISAKTFLESKGIVFTNLTMA